MSTNARTDVELVDLSRQGDKEAFGQLIQRYQETMARFAAKVVADRESALELTQEAMLQAYLSFDRLIEPVNFKGWLYGIVLNVCRSYLRDQKAVFYSLDAMPGGLLFASLPDSNPAISPERIAEERELNQKVLGVINSLGPSDRDITLRFYYEELSLREIAILQDISLSAVKVRLYRARQRLKAKLLAQYSEFTLYVDRRNELIKVNVFDVVKRERAVSQGRTEISYIVILLDEQKQRVLPIWIGPFEGQAMASILGELTSPRPLTYDFFSTLLKAIKAKIEQVRIETLRGNTFYATVQIRCGQTTEEIDARPSDALNLAILTSAPVFVSEDVLSVAGGKISSSVKLSAQPTGVDTILDEIRTMQKEVQIQLAKMTTATARSKEEIQKGIDDLLNSIYGAPQ